MKIKLTAPIERIEPLKAEISIDPTPTMADSSVEVNSSIQETMNLIDTVAVLARVEALSESNGKKFVRYCAKFDANKTLPKGAAAWFQSTDTDTKLVWLFLRWDAMRSHVSLAGFVPTRPLNDEELSLAIQAILNDPSITDVNQI